MTSTARVSLYAVEESAEVEIIFESRGPGEKCQV